MPAEARSIEEIVKRAPSIRTFLNDKVRTSTFGRSTLVSKNVYFRISRAFRHLVYAVPLRTQIATNSTSKMHSMEEYFSTPGKYLMKEAGITPKL